LGKDENQHGPSGGHTKTNSVALGCSGSQTQSPLNRCRL